MFDGSNPSNFCCLGIFFSKLQPSSVFLLDR